MAKLPKKASYIKQKRMAELVELLRIHRELASSYFVRVNRHVVHSWRLDHSSLTGVSPT